MHSHSLTGHVAAPRFFSVDRPQELTRVPGEDDAGTPEFVRRASAARS
ncbi:hypothetical protein EBESD8_49960 [Rhodococcus aetherivorans]|nr:hypothetical protein EBESD8_49960 [Rhodococcus aetherivorans]